MPTSTCIKQNIIRVTMGGSFYIKSASECSRLRADMFYINYGKDNRPEINDYGEYILSNTFEDRDCLINFIDSVINCRAIYQSITYNIEKSVNITEMLTSYDLVPTNSSALSQKLSSVDCKSCNEYRSQSYKCDNSTHHFFICYNTDLCTLSEYDWMAAARIEIRLIPQNEYIALNNSLTRYCVEATTDTFSLVSYSDGKSMSESLSLAIAITIPALAVFKIITIWLNTKLLERESRREDKHYTLLSEY